MLQSDMICGVFKTLCTSATMLSLSL
jgi:hypothetical protein